MKRLVLVALLTLTASMALADGVYTRSVARGSVGGGAGSAALTNTYVGYGSAGNTLTGDPSLTYSTGNLSTFALTTTGGQVTVDGTQTNAILTGSSVTSRGLQMNDGGTANAKLFPWGTGMTLACSITSGNCQFRFTDSGNTSRFTVYPGNGASGVLAVGSNIAPSATIHVTSGTLIPGICTANVQCGANQRGAMCFSTAKNFPVFCNGANSWIQLVSATLVSASAL